MHARPLAHSMDMELLERCRAGDGASWRALHQAYFPYVWRTARALGTPPEELDDVCQEVFEVAFRKLDRFRDGLFTTWLYRIIANVVSSRHRRRRVRRAFTEMLQRSPPPPAVRTPAQIAEARQVERAVAEVLERMAPRKREVFALFELEGLSGEEIAERVGCGVATVWTRLFHARRDFERIARKRGVLP